MHALQTKHQQPTNSPALHAKRQPRVIGSAWRWLSLALPLALALVGWSTTSNASEYAIQVGAFKTPNQTYAENLRSYGEVNTSQSSNGVTVFTVGRYNSVDEAKGDLNRIAADFPGAFVRNMPNAARSADFVAAAGTNKATRSKAAAPQRRSTPDTQLWESLSESERRRVVYLDGVLHLKQGDQFVPLAEYRRSQAQ